MLSKKITNVVGRMVFDSRGYPTVEAEVQVDNNFYGASISPSGASKGKKEALEKYSNVDSGKQLPFKSLKEELDRRKKDKK